MLTLHFPCKSLVSLGGRDALQGGTQVENSLPGPSSHSLGWPLHGWHGVGQLLCYFKSQLL